MDAQLFANSSSEFEKFLQSPTSVSKARKTLNVLYDHISNYLKDNNANVIVKNNRSVLEKWLEVCLLIQTKFKADQDVNEFTKLTFTAMFFIAQSSERKELAEFLDSTSILFTYSLIYKKLTHIPNKRLLLSAASKALEIAEITDLVMQNLCQELTVEVCQSKSKDDLIKHLSHHWDSYIYQDIRTQFGDHLIETYFLDKFCSVLKENSFESLNDWLPTFNNALHSIKFVLSMSTKLVEIFENLFRNFVKMEKDDVFYFDYLVIFDSLLVTAHYNLSWNEEIEFMEKIRPLFKPQLDVLRSLVKAGNNCFIIYAINILTIIDDIDNDDIAICLKSSINYVLRLIKHSLDKSDLSFHFNYRCRPYISVADHTLLLLNRLLINDKFKAIVAKTDVVDDLLKMLENPNAPHAKIITVFVQLLEFGDTKKKLRIKDFQALVCGKPSKFKIPESLEENNDFKKSLDFLKFDDVKETSIIPNDNTVMISYQWDTKDVVREVKEFLVNKDFEVWIDEERMHGNMYQRMAEGIENSKYIVAFVTKRYKESANCEKELSYAESEKKNIIPVYVDTTYKPKGWLGLILGVYKIYIPLKHDAIKDTGNEIYKHIKLIEKDLSKKPQS